VGHVHITEIAADLPLVLMVLSSFCIRTAPCDRTS